MRIDTAIILVSSSGAKNTGKECLKDILYRAQRSKVLCISLTQEDLRMTNSVVTENKPTPTAICSTRGFGRKIRNMVMVNCTEQMAL